MCYGKDQAYIYIVRNGGKRNGGKRNGGKKWWEEKWRELMAGKMANFYQPALQRLIFCNKKQQMHQTYYNMALISKCQQKKYDIDFHVEIHMCAKKMAHLIHIVNLMTASAVTMEYRQHLTGWLGQSSL
jgi:hypothetical protein